jgi:hypothetical protein
MILLEVGFFLETGQIGVVDQQKEFGDSQKPRS